MFRYSAKYLHTWCLIQGFKFWSYYNSSHFITKEFPAIFTQSSEGTYIILQLRKQPQEPCFLWRIIRRTRIQIQVSWLYMILLGEKRWWIFIKCLCVSGLEKRVYCALSQLSIRTFPPYRWGDWDSENGSHWKKVTQVGIELGLIASHSIL